MLGSLMLPSVLWVCTPGCGGPGEISPLEHPVRAGLLSLGQPGQRCAAGVTLPLFSTPNLGCVMRQVQVYYRHSKLGNRLLNI